MSAKSVLVLSRQDLQGGEKIKFRPEGEVKHVEGRFCGITSGGYLRVQVEGKTYLVLPTEAQLLLEASY